jgi:signal transduction histidine kinase
MDVVIAVLRAPFTPRCRRELVFCVVGLAYAAVALAIPAGVAVLGAFARGRGDQPAPEVAPGAIIGLAALIVLIPFVARALGAGHRRLAARLLGLDIPRPLSTVGPVVYALVKVPLGLLEGYAAAYWVTGVVNLTYPFWWGLFRNHAPGSQLGPVAVITPLGTFDITTYPATLLAFAAGVASLLAAPWVIRAVTTVDSYVMRGLLGPGPSAERIQHLEQTRARAVDDAAATLRKLERDLHDGAQIRLATLAMNLGQATEDLGRAGDPPDLDRARELVATAHRGAKEALAELRDLVRGLHPPVLDNGLGDALATLTATSPIPTSLAVDLPSRPAPAIETIAYFCVAELLTNAAKHSGASQVAVDAHAGGDRLRVRVADNGAGGARFGVVGGLSGLTERVSTVDGRIAIDSPDGGPTVVVVDLPLRP